MHRSLIVTILLATLALPSTGQADDRLVIGVPPWDGAQAKTAVVSEILQAMGYSVEILEASAPMVFQAMARGEVDINLSAWKPGQDEAFQPLVDAGDIRILGENLSGAWTGLAVPEAVYQAGLDSKARLTEFADRLDSTIQCIEPGSGAVAVTEAAIENDHYGLSDWNLMTTSTAGMLSQVGRSIDRDEWVVFCGWSPHWMNLRYEMRFLEDPENHWGNEGNGTRVYTLVRKGFSEDFPDVAKFLGRFHVESEVQSYWIKEYAYRDRSLEEMAVQWITDHPEIVGQWLEGLQTRDGHEAVEAVGRRFDGQ